MLVLRQPIFIHDSFRAGDKIAVSKSSGQDSWWFGNLESGEEGYFPLSYVEDLWADSYE